MDTKRFIAAAAVCAALTPAPGFAAEAVEPAPDFVEQAAGTGLQPCSAARVKAWMLFRVARANVYLPDCADLARPLPPPAALRFAYEREVPARAFTESANEMLERNIPAETFAELEPALRDFNDQYQNVDEGDTYHMLRTDQRLVLWRNGRELASVEHPELARHYFRIWFGEEPFSERLRTELLRPLD